MPNLLTIRPADATETGAAWVTALRHTTGPSAIMLTRQNLPVIDRSKHPAASNLGRGAYVLWQSAADKAPDLILLASGSEVSLALQTAQTLAAECTVRVVSMPCWELFEQQTAQYRDEVLPRACTARLAIETGVSFGWERYVGERGAVHGIDRYGASAPYQVLAEKFGFTPANIAAKARALLARKA
jgi:transketolase